MIKSSNFFMCKLFKKCPVVKYISNNSNYKPFNLTKNNGG